MIKNLLSKLLDWVGFMDSKGESGFDETYEDGKHSPENEKRWQRVDEDGN